MSTSLSELTYADAFLNRGEIFLHINSTMLHVDRILRFANAGLIKYVHDDLLLEHDSYLKRLCHHFLLVMYEKKYENIDELDGLLRRINSFYVLSSQNSSLPLNVESEPSSTQQVVEILTSVNNMRLTAVWSDLMAPALLESFNTTDSIGKFALPKEITGELSFILYGMRFSYVASNIIEISSSTLKDDDKKKLEEQGYGFINRIYTHATEQKYILMNDFFWGIDNFLQYVNNKKNFLLGAAMYLDLALFTFDVTISMSMYLVEKQQYEAKRLVFFEKKTDFYNHEIKKLDLEWKFKSKKLFRNCFFALSFLAGIALYSLCPPVLIGASLLLGASFLQNINDKHLDIRHTKAQLKLIEAQMLSLQLDDDDIPFKDLEETKKIKFLAYSAAKKDLANKTVDLQIQKRSEKISLILNILVPVLSMAFLILAPTGIGFAAVGGLLLCVLYLKYQINKQEKAQKKIKQQDIDVRFDHKEDMTIKQLLSLDTKESLGISKK